MLDKIEEAIEAIKNGEVIIVVDDEDTIRYFLRLELEDQNYEVWDAETGEKALKLIETHAFDVALLDLRLSTDIGGSPCRGRDWRRVPMPV